MKYLLTGVGVALIFLALSFPATGSTGLPQLEQSKAYQAYVKRPKNEMSKLLFLMDRFKESQLSIIYNGHIYKPGETVIETKRYIAKNFNRGELAEQWLNVHAYKSSSGKPIYFKYSDGKTRLMRDVMLEELNRLNKKEK